MQIGGTWHWNKYPGAACDVGSYSYLPYLHRMRFVPSKKYVTAPEIKAHLHNIADTEGLYDKTLLETKVTTAVWDETGAVWRYSFYLLLVAIKFPWIFWGYMYNETRQIDRVSTDRGDKITARFLVCAAYF